MDASRFDRLIRTISDRVLRRQALRALAGGSVVLAAGVADKDAAEGKNKRKRCRKPGGACGGRKKCCQGKGAVLCQEFSNPLCEGVSLTGNRCCGVEGTVCDPEFGTSLTPTEGSHGNCSCCAGLYCGKQTDGSFRCQTEET